MRFVIAMMKHETNTFSPVPTPLQRFALDGKTVLSGKAAEAAYRGTGSATGAFIDIAERAGAEIEVPACAYAWPSGPVEDAAFEEIAEMICAGIARGCDAAFLDLHGSMVTDSHEDGEGALLARIRGIAPELPIAVSLDMHANVSSDMVSNATVIAGYQTYPHVDLHGTGVRAGEALLRSMRGEITPVMAWRNLPMLPHIMRQSTDDSPHRELQQLAAAVERDRAVLCSLFMGFPHADIRDAGSSAVVVTDGDRQKAEAIRDELLDRLWGERENLVYVTTPLVESVARAKRLEEGPIILLDHYDNAASGGTMDCTAVLAEIMRQGLSDVAVFAIHDPQAVAEMARAGVGRTVTLTLGGKLPLGGVADANDPVTVTGSVRLLSDGIFRNKGPMNRGVTMNMGFSAVLDTGSVEIVVISRHQEPNDVACLTSLGIDPAAKKYLMLKSRVHFRASLGRMAKHIVECSGNGVCTSDYGRLPFRNVRRPMFPLDRGFEQPERPA